MTRRTAPGWILAALAALLVAVVLVSRATGDPVAHFTRDFFSTAEVPIYTGIVSNVGVFLWGVTAAICFFAIGAMEDPVRDREVRRWILATAMVSAILMLDDFFMFHEWIFPRLTGLDETVVLGVYAVAFTGYLAAFRRSILAAGPELLVLALVLLGASLVMDLIEPEDAAAWRYLTEEGFKLLGIGAWLGFFLGVAYEAVSPGQRRAQATAASNSASP